MMLGVEAANSMEFTQFNDAVNADKNTVAAKEDAELV
jgi:hypothetical protein